ncbi:MAG TPA: hypothetical protein VGM01_04845 [Ktedonobacteraceae bacterium]
MIHKNDGLIICIFIKALILPRRPARSTRQVSRAQTISAIGIQPAHGKRQERACSLQRRHDPFWASIQ